mmetsp:Transcript_11574/g.15291  ORF Transcript_11574/g.15291 Transcript_11574/m.15291 type:complete len:81 (+) Transcript_11574:185-427(+)
MEFNFEAKKPSGLSTSYSENAILLSKVSGAAKKKGLRAGDEVIALNGECCQRVGKDLFRKRFKRCGKGDMVVSIWRLEQD